MVTQIPILRILFIGSYEVHPKPGIKIIGVKNKIGIKGLIYLNPMCIGIVFHYRIYLINQYII